MFQPWFIHHCQINDVLVIAYIIHRAVKYLTKPWPLYRASITLTPWPTFLIKQSKVSFHPSRNNMKHKILQCRFIVPWQLSLLENVPQWEDSQSRLIQFNTWIRKRKTELRNLRGGGGGTWVNFCWVCAAGLSEPLPHDSVFCCQL